MKQTIIVYALALAAMAWLLNAIRYPLLVRSLPTQWSLVIVALLFAALGIWMGLKLTGNSRPGEFDRNVKAQAYLGLSDRELEVLQLVAQGLSNQQIADRLFLSGNTVKSHLKNVFAKLDVARRTQAVQKARELRLIL